MLVSLFLILTLSLASVGAFKRIMTKSRLDATSMRMIMPDRGLNKIITAFAVGLMLPVSMGNPSSSLFCSDGAQVMKFQSINVVKPSIAVEDIIYKSGKTPEKFKNKNKDDKTGTKKETKFLRCMSNCKSECQKPRDGLASLDCNQDCQDQCCESYEQCSFKVRTRSSEM
jgi:hypothetical protein